MVSRAVKVRLGVFLSIGLILGLIFVIAVAGDKLLDKRDIYYVEFENFSVSGLQVGGEVRYNGIMVGRVEAIKINPKDITKIILTLSLDKGTPIKENTEAVLIFVGITGVKAVELKGGTNDSPMLKQGGYIKAGTTMLDSISDKAGSIADKIDELTANLNNMTNEENRRNLAEILNQTSLLIRDTRQNLTQTITSITTISENAAEITSEASQKFGQLADQLSLSMNELTSSSTQSIETISGSAATALDSISLTTRASIEELTRSLTRDVESLTLNLNESIDEISSQTSLLLADTRTQVNNLGTHSDELILSTTRDIATLSGSINSSLERVNQILMSEDFDRIISNVAVLSNKLNDMETRDLLSELTLTINRAGSLISNLDRTLIRSRSNIFETLESLREASENLNDFSRQISDTPSILLRGN